MTSNGPRAPWLPFFGTPVALVAAAGFALRLAVGIQGLAHNPLLTTLQLDSEYYVDWAREIWAGDLASAHGQVEGSPFVLNPLYAYVIAPIVGLAADPGLPIVVFQAILGAATAALSAAAAERFFGRVAAWTAGIAVAFSSVLVHLDSHVGVAGLAAFLTAGAVFASAPAPEGATGRGHGPVASGLWLGLGSLARPIPVLVLPFFAWRQGRTRGWRRALLLAAVFGVCGALSLARNWAVAGEPVVYTSAGGANLHLGNNPEARKYRSMTSPHFRFTPTEMHRDAHDYVVTKKGGNPSASDVSSELTRETIEEFVREPAISAAYYANKARWFFSPIEVPSTASYEMDLSFAPLLHLAFVPTWLLACVAAVAAFVLRRRQDVVCGPTAIVLAHLAVLTLVFPLSHYRSPAIPAMAVLAGGALQTGLAAWRAGTIRTAVAMMVSVAAVAVGGALPPQPDPLVHGTKMLLGLAAADRGDYDQAEAYVHEAMEAFREQWPDYRELPAPWQVLGGISGRRGRWSLAVEQLTKALAITPRDLKLHGMRSYAARRAGDLNVALGDAQWIVDAAPSLPEGHARLGEALVSLGRASEARPHLQYAADLRVPVDPEAMRRANVTARAAPLR